MKGFLKMKKYMIRCDIEGVTGVVSYEQAEPGKAEFTFGKKMFMADLIALIEGLNDGGADEIYIYDEHYYGRNIDIDALPSNVIAICGKPPYLKDWAGGLDESFTGLILLGFHSKRGTENALLNHTYEPDIKNINLNGVSVGEIGMESAIGGDYNVPLALIIADSKGVDEAKRLIHGVKSVTVKESLSETGALCYPLEVTSKKIYEAAIDVAKNFPTAKPYSLCEVCLEVELKEGKFRSVYEKLYSDQIENGVTTINAKTATAVWAIYWERKLRCYMEMEA